MKRKSTLILLLSLLATACLWGQAQLAGRVTVERGEPAVGVNLFLKGTYSGAVTDADGRFQFAYTPADSQVLVASYIGYQPWAKLLEETADSLWLDIALVPQATELQQVVISAGAFEASDEKKAVMLRSLDIATTAGANADIVTALNTLPGTQANPEDGRLFVRGGDAHEAAMFIDGMRVPNFYTSTVPDLPARGRFSPFLFKGMAFSTGGYSAAYGQALSSAVTLETKDLPEASVSSLSLMSVGLGAAHTQRWEETSLSVEADYTNLGPYMRLAPQHLEWDRPVQAQSGQVGFRHRLPKGGIIKAQGNAARSGFALRYPESGNPEQHSTLELGNANYYGQATYQGLAGEQWAFDAGLAASYDREQIEQGFALDRQQRGMQARGVATRYFEQGWAVRMGAEWLSSRWDERFADEQSADFHTLLDDHQLAAFAEGEGHLGERWALRAGLRTEHSNLLSASSLAPRLSVAYKAGKYGQFSAAYGQFYQNPLPQLLRYGQDLGLERADHYLLGYQYQRGGRSLRAELYHKEYLDLVRYPFGQPWLSDNSGEGYARGFDLFYRDRASIRNGDFWVSYAWLDTERAYRGFPEAGAPPFASAHNLSVVYKHWLHRLNTSVGLTCTLASPRTYDDPNSPLFNDMRTQTFQDLSFNASYLTELFGHFTILYVSVTNVPGFNQSFGQRFSEQPNAAGVYTSVAVQPPAPRFFFVGLFVSIGDGQQFGN